MLGAIPNLSTNGGLVQAKKSARLKDADKSGQQTKVANAKSGALPDQPTRLYNIIVLFFSFVIEGGEIPLFCVKLKKTEFFNLTFSKL